MLASLSHGYNTHRRDFLAIEIIAYALASFKYPFLSLMSAMLFYLIIVCVTNLGVRDKCGVKFFPDYASKHVDSVALSL